MQDGCRHRAQRMRLARFGQAQCRESDFLARHRIDLGAEHLRHELCAEANTERRQCSLEPVLDQRTFGGEKRKSLGIIRTDRPAEDNDKVRIARGVEVALRRVNDLGFYAALSKHVINATQILKGQMLNDVGLQEGH